MSLARSIRRSSCAAANMIRAIFASSDGCTPNPAMPNQRRVPLIGSLNSTATSASPVTPTAVARTAGFFNRR